VLSLHGRQNQGRFFFQESTGISSTYKDVKGAMGAREKGILLKF